MALIGHTAASFNIFLDIPLLLRGLSQSMIDTIGPKFSLSTKLLEEIKRVDPSDPTGIVNEYLSDWWNFAKKWETQPVEVDQEAAFQWHVQKVNEILYLVPGADTPPDR
jgi:hypothetical protein